MSYVDADFPSNYVNGAHPEDYTVTDRPITPEKILHDAFGANARVLWRVSWRTPDDRYVPLTFVLDTGAPESMYLGHRARETLMTLGVLAVDRELQTTRCVRIWGRRTWVVMHDGPNVIGLAMLQRMGFALNQWDFDSSCNATPYRFAQNAERVCLEH